MKVTGFTFIRNAIKFDYPIVEAIKSVLPLCDEFIVAVGKSEDETEVLLKNLDSKIIILPTVWDDSLREGGRVLAEETNKAFDAISQESNWCFYIQGDEVIHEKYYENIRNAMLQYKDDEKVEGLLLKYLHFFGSYHYVADSRSWYRQEIRIIKNKKNIRSYKDAQGFRKKDNSKLKVKAVDAWVYHYGWVKDPSKQQKKAETFNKLWHDDEWVKKHVPEVEFFDYSCIDSLDLFKGEHPAIMKERISKMNWEFVFDINKKRLTLREKILMQIEKYTGWRIGEYKNYKEV